ncbi:MAG: autotransporter strand-loop-strand O-heptosyltransferase [Selenomonadaceae bacterium]|nr:autotransporter strand-loop-strand O-heptosyltransferase [Selenomonadaceae bacterium]
MRKLIFCARDIRDYLKEKTDIIDAPIIQKKLFDLMKIYPQCMEFCEAPIYFETGIEGLCLDFNFGLRLDVPEGNFHVRIGDDNGQIFFDKDISDVRLISFEKFFIRWKVEVSCDGRKIFEHEFNPECHSVQIVLRNRAPLGDTLAMLPSVEEFRRHFKCEVAVLVPEYLKEITAHLYPALKQVDRIGFENYATFYLLAIMSPLPYLPVDARNNCLERMGISILGLNILPPKPIFKPTAQRFCEEPYVCIGAQASTPTKGWLYPNGWEIVVDYLKSLGYRVLCIDKQKVQREGNYFVTMPTNAEDFTGDFSIMERANMLYYSEFFIGLGSGLAWLANAVDCPVVMICGFSQDWLEFYTPYRVANRLVCNGCFNDVRVGFMNVCPYHKGTARELECQKKIYPRQVINAIERLILDKKLTPPILK